MIIGYTAGVFDLLHIGHINLIRNAKNLCDRLIVGVSTDEYVKQYKNKTPIIPFEDRITLVRELKCVDAVVKQENTDRIALHGKIKFDIMFVGDDWYQAPNWVEMDKKFSKLGIKIIYLPYTSHTSTTKIKADIKKY